MRVKKLLALFLALSMLVPALCLAGSADEFEILPGDCAFSFSAQRACTLTVSVRGRFR